MLAVAKESPTLLNGNLRTATSYPNALRSFIGRTGINAYVGPIRSGKVEGTVKQGIADAVFDIRETGESLEANNLTVVAEGEVLQLGGIWLDDEAEP